MIKMRFFRIWKLNDLGLDTSAMTTANQDSYSSRILWALLQLSQQNQPESNNDETVGVYITNEGRRNVTRNSVAQLGFRLTATAHINDSQGVTLDPDAPGSLGCPVMNQHNWKPEFDVKK